MAMKEVLERFEVFGCWRWSLSVHGGLLACSALTRSLSDFLPALSLDLRVSPQHQRLPPSVRMSGHPLSRVASPERYVGLRVSGESCASGVPSRCLLRGLWRSGSIGVFSCVPDIRTPSP